MKHYQISIYINTTGEVNVDEAIKDACDLLDNIPELEVEDVHFEELPDEEPPEDSDIGLEKIEKN